MNFLGQILEIRKELERREKARGRKKAGAVPEAPKVSNARLLEKRNRLLRRAIGTFRRDFQEALKKKNPSWEDVSGILARLDQFDEKLFGQGPAMEGLPDGLIDVDYASVLDYADRARKARERYAQGLEFVKEMGNRTRRWGAQVREIVEKGGDVKGEAEFGKEIQARWREFGKAYLENKDTLVFREFRDHLEEEIAPYRKFFIEGGTLESDDAPPIALALQLVHLPKGAVSERYKKLAGLEAKHRGELERNLGRFFDGQRAGAGRDGVRVAGRGSIPKPKPKGPKAQTVRSKAPPGMKGEKSEEKKGGLPEAWEMAYSALMRKKGKFEWNGREYDVKPQGDSWLLTREENGAKTTVRLDPRTGQVHSVRVDRSDRSLFFSSDGSRRIVLANGKTLHFRPVELKDGKFDVSGLPRNDRKTFEQMTPFYTHVLDRYMAAYDREKGRRFPGWRDGGGSRLVSAEVVESRGGGGRSKEMILTYQTPNGSRMFSITSKGELIDLTHRQRLVKAGRKGEIRDKFTIPWDYFDRFNSKRGHIGLFFKAHEFNHPKNRSGEKEGWGFYFEADFRRKQHREQGRRPSPERAKLTEYEWDGPRSVGGIESVFGAFAQAGIYYATKGSREEMNQAAWSKERSYTDWEKGRLMDFAKKMEGFKGKVTARRLQQWWDEGGVSKRIKEKLYLDLRKERLDRYRKQGLSLPMAIYASQVLDPEPTAAEVAAYAIRRYGTEGAIGRLAKIDPIAGGSAAFVRDAPAGAATAWIMALSRRAPGLRTAAKPAEAYFVGDMALQMGRDIRDAIATWNDPNATEAEKNAAKAKLFEHSLGSGGFLGLRAAAGRLARGAKDFLAKRRNGKEAMVGAGADRSMRSSPEGRDYLDRLKDSTLDREKMAALKAKGELQGTVPARDTVKQCGQTCVLDQMVNNRDSSVGTLIHQGKLTREQFFAAVKKEFGKTGPFSPAERRKLLGMLGYKLEGGKLPTPERIRSLVSKGPFPIDLNFKLPNGRNVGHAVSITAVLWDKGTGTWKYVLVDSNTRKFLALSFADLMDFNARSRNLRPVGEGQLAKARGFVDPPPGAPMASVAGAKPAPAGPPGAARPRPTVPSAAPEGFVKGWGYPADAVPRRWIQWLGEHGLNLGNVSPRSTNGKSYFHPDEIRIAVERRLRARAARGNP